MSRIFSKRGIRQYSIGVNNEMSNVLIVALENVFEVGKLESAVNIQWYHPKIFCRKRQEIQFSLEFVDFLEAYNVGREYPLKLFKLFPEDPPPQISVEQLEVEVQLVHQKPATTVCKTLIQIVIVFMFAQPVVLRFDGMVKPHKYPDVLFDFAQNQSAGVHEYSLPSAFFLLLLSILADQQATTKVVDALRHPYCIALLLQRHLTRVICYDLRLLNIDLDRLSFWRLPSRVVDEKLRDLKTFHTIEDLYRLLWYNYNLI